jgi:hypothetical protein
MKAAPGKLGCTYSWLGAFEEDRTLARDRMEGVPCARRDMDFAIRSREDLGDWPDRAVELAFGDVEDFEVLVVRMRGYQQVFGVRGNVGSSVVLVRLGQEGLSICQTRPCSKSSLP